MPRGMAHLATVSSHGGTIISGEGTVTVCGSRMGARCMDLHVCPLKDHGVTPIVTCAPDVTIRGRGSARQFDVAGCGAVLLLVCPTVTSR